MNAPTLDSLPVEILRCICECLDREHAASVLALACTSKRCYSATTAILFHTIRFSWLDSPDLATDVQECYDKLQRAASFKHVRRLELNHKTHQEDDSWRPLANLIKSLPVLEQLIYECPRPFPALLLQTLHERRPQCRLYINNFQLHSLKAPVTDAAELMLVTSPCLYSIRVQYEEMGGRDSWGKLNYHLEAVMRLVRGLAPNLKEVHMTHNCPGAGLNDGEPWQPWKGFTLDERRNGTSEGALRYLGLFSYMTIDRQVLGEWRAHTDFSVLRILKLPTSIDEDALEFLATDCSFSSLESLALYLGPRDSYHTVTSEYFDKAKSFLRSLPPLSTLELSGELHRLPLNSFLEHHGSNLGKLSLSPWEGVELPSHEDIAQVGVLCPSLEDLKLTLRRSRGDAIEVAAYRALGSQTKIRNLRLRLDASHYAIYSEENDQNLRDDEEPDIPNDPSFDDFDQQFFKRSGFGNYRNPRNGHMRDAFINSALDETLARSIFGAISSAKPSGSSFLERLEVQVSGGTRFGQGWVSMDLETVIGNLARSWLIERNPRDDCRQELLATELGKREREKYEAGHRTSRALEISKTEHVFRRIWPAKQKDSGDWRDDWQSFPLATNDT